jgi:hypothetical protein
VVPAVLPLLDLLASTEVTTQAKTMVSSPATITNPNPLDTISQEPMARDKATTKRLTLKARVDPHSPAMDRRTADMEPLLPLTHTDVLPPGLLPVAIPRSRDHPTDSLPHPRGTDREMRMTRDFGTFKPVIVVVLFLAMAAYVEPCHDIAN